MLNVLTFVVEIIQNYTYWVYIVCGAVILWNVRRYLLARNDRRNTIFPVEREIAAHREGQAMSTIGAMLAICVAAVAIRYFLLPSLDVAELVEPTPTATLLIPTREPTPTTPPTAAPTPTARTMPTQQPTAEVVPTTAATNTPEPPPPRASCPDPNVCITSPTNGATVSGSLAIQGTANHAQFQFYKIELGVGTDPTSWSSIGETVGHPVSDGTLAVFNTQVVPNGTYTLRLVVVDITGNYPAPYEVTVNVAN
ncbi:MAG: Ig-like domain-containing protein [Anaerolineales bacterium]